MVKKPAFALTLAVSFLSVGMAFFRTFYTQDFTYSYMPINLALAWIPFLLSLTIRTLMKQGKRFLSCVLGVFWLFFYPNTFYLITDYIHLRLRPPIPMWFDALMLTLFAVLGAVLGFASLYLIARLLKKYLNEYLLTAAILTVASFGVYIGRFLRWNSWDIIFRPDSLFADVIASLHQPLAVVFTLGSSVVLVSLYWMVRSLLRSVFDR